MLLNQPLGNLPQEMSIAERGSEWVQEDLGDVMSHFSKLEAGI